MALAITPTVLIDGIAVACRAKDLDAAPVAIRGFDITWGRDEYMAPEVEPSSARLTLLDTTDTWANRIRESRAVGATVVIQWTGTPSDGTPSIGPVVLFRGRVQQARATPHTTETADGRRAWLIELDAADRTADLGNAIAPPVTWPVESMIVRANRIRTLGRDGGSGIAEMYFWPGYVDRQVCELDVKGKSSLDLMQEMYASMGNDAWAYDPHENVVRQAIRLSQPMGTYLASFDDTRGAVLPVADDITVDGKTYPGIGLGACVITSDIEVAADPATDINRIECTWPDHSTGKDWTTVKEAVKSFDARRVMSWTAWFTHGEVIDPTLENVWNRARNEGARPRHPSITIRTGHTITTERLARWLLQAWENTRPAFISGSWPYRWLMQDSTSYMPIVAPIGGVTSFDPLRGWQASLNVHWIHNQSAAPAPATWAKLQQVKTSTSQPDYPWWYPLLGIPLPKPVTVGTPMPERDLKWGDLDGYHFDRSVTWSDLRHVDNARLQVKDILK